ncbi:MAG TPA: hypothetical protein IAA58_01690 [Candidatus Gallacutalibacter stercoravium]|nr:hypothetical protein [Candidatus Gallacutalibacter stercoravium]
MDASYPRFFLGANAPGGFVSRFDHLYSPQEGWFAYILKGGPGTGKSSLMKRAAEEAHCANIPVELIHCSSDPDSLDAVIFPRCKACIVDGTAPHTLDPRYPGVADAIVNLGECWDGAQLEAARTQIIQASEKTSGYHQRAQRYLAACGALQDDCHRMIRAGLDLDKLQRFAANLCKRLFSKAGGAPGRETVRLISAVTPEGIVYYEDTLKQFCDYIYVIEDEFDSMGSVLLEQIRDKALLAGADVISCYCPMSPLKRIEALIIPSINFAFAVANSWHPLSGITPYRRIHARRFLKAGLVSARRQKLGFNRRISRALLAEAVTNLRLAKETHDELEAFYERSMDYSKVDAIYDSLIADIFRRSCFSD